MDNKLEVSAVRRGEHGEMEEFKLSNGSVVNFAECQKLINDGKLDLISTTGKNGVDVIRSYPDGDESNNLSSKPEF